MSDAPRLAVGSVANHEPAVLAEFLFGLEHLALPAAWPQRPNFIFVDANDDPRSSTLLSNFAARHDGQVRILPSPSPYAGAPPWSHAAAKDLVLAEASKDGATHVLLVESNIVVPPPLPAHLLGLGLDVVAEVYWTEWDLGADALPQVWLSDQYNLWPPGAAPADAKEKLAAAGSFLSKLHDPGTYEVGGLGGCVMLSKAAIDRKVSFRPLPNISFWGDDRHFCIRAASLDIGLWADTYYPPLHLYRAQDQRLVPHFWAKWAHRPTEAA